MKNIVKLERQLPFVSRSFATSNHLQWATEWVGNKNDSEPPPTKTTEKDGKIAIFLHGLLGNKRNVKGFATSVCKSLDIPGLLMDVRGHGDSQLPESMRGERTTFSDCVKDMNETLLTAVPDIQDRELILMGHSMGGRVALMYTLEENVWKKPSHLWLLDTVPGKISGSVQNILSVAQKLVDGIDEHNVLQMKRRELIEYLMEKHKIDLGTAQWLGSSFDPSLPRKFKFDLKVAYDLVEEFQNIDFVDCLEQARKEQPEVRIHMVRGGANTAWETSNTLDFFQKWEQLEVQNNQNMRKFSFHTLPKAGHWVHIDDPNGLLEAVESIHKNK